MAGTQVTKSVMRAIMVSADIDMVRSSIAVNIEVEDNLTRSIYLPDPDFGRSVVESSTLPHAKRDEFLTRCPGL